MLNAVQDNSPPNVVQVVDRVIVSMECNQSCIISLEKMFKIKIKKKSVVVSKSSFS